MEPTAGLAQTAIINRHFTTPGVDPLDEVEWVRRDAWPRSGDEKMDEATAGYFNPGVLVPASWRQNDLDVTSKLYLSKADPVERKSVRRLIERVWAKITLEAIRHGYVSAPVIVGVDALPDFPDFEALDRCRRTGDEVIDPFWNHVLFEDSDAATLYAEGCYLAVHQMAAFNSPVWFNVGRKDRIQQVSACYILRVDDNTGSLTDTNTRNAYIFKYGSGAGYNLSFVRGDMEELSTGGVASGPLSFRRMYDATNGTFKSGGMTRRAAELVCMDDDHPNLVQFIEVKPREEERQAILIKNGVNLTMGEEGERNLAECTSYQNANMSVRLTNRFMRKFTGEDDDPMWRFVARVTGEPIGEPQDARALFQSVAEAAWKCADPGVQYHDHFNDWHTTPMIDGEPSPIRSTNPCARRGTRLFTADGWQPIEELAERGGAFIFDGVGFVFGKVWKTGEKGLVRLTTNTGRTIDLTPDHKVYTEEGWVEASRCEGKTLPFIEPSAVPSSREYLPKIVRDVKHYEPMLMESLGFLQGDGTLNPSSKVTSVCYTPEKDGAFAHNTIAPVLAHVAASDDFYAMRDTGNKLVCSRGSLYDWLVDGMGYQPVSLPDRELPSFIWDAPRGAQAAFLRGLFGANGSVINTSREVVTLVSTCRPMLKQVQMLLQGLGIASKILRHNKPQMIEWENGEYESRESFRLELTFRQDLERFADRVGFPQVSQQEKLGVILQREMGPNGGPVKRAHQRVISVEVLNEVDEVYDFNVSTTHLGLADGLVISNCGEYASNDDTSCNLASINLVPFVDDGPDEETITASNLPTIEDYRRFKVEDFRHTVDTMIVAMDVLVELSDFPDDPERGGQGKFRHYTKRLRQLGLGYCNLGGALMTQCIPYDSEEGRDWGASVAALMTGRAYRKSAELAKKMEPFHYFDENRESMLGVIEKHMACLPTAPMQSSDIWLAARSDWNSAHDGGRMHGYRNAQASVLAPTGSISYLMGCDSTGVEPVFDKVALKILAGGGEQIMVADCVQHAAQLLGGYSDEDLAQMAAGDFSCISEEDRAIFYGANEISVDGHILMLGRVQPFISGGISKTVNLPESATVQDIIDAYLLAWRQGVKNVAVYRNNSKVRQVLHSYKPPEEEPFRELDQRAEQLDDFVDSHPEVLDDRIAAEVDPRRRMPRTRKSITHKISIRAAAGREHEGYVHVGFYPDGGIGEFFIEGFGKSGSFTLNALGQWATDFSIAIQYGVPFDVLIRKAAYTSDETGGVVVPDPHGEPLVIRTCESVIDYIARYLASVSGDEDLCEELGVMTPAVKERKELGAALSTSTTTIEVTPTGGIVATGNGHAREAVLGPECSQCGQRMFRSGACWACRCGSTDGCG